MKDRSTRAPGSGVGTSGDADARRRRRAITLEDRDFILSAAAWAAKADASTIDIGLSPDVALHRVPEFLRGLREGKISPAEARLDDAGIDVLHAACRLLTERSAVGVEEPFDSVRALDDFIEKITWPGPDFDERRELFAACAFAGWRIARHKATPSEIEQWQSRLVSAISALDYSGGAHEESKKQEWKTDPAFSAETLLLSLEKLRQRCEAAPEKVLEETASLYSFLEKLEPPADAFFLDERDYFLGETARVAGAVCRILSLRDEARRWFDRSEGWFRHTEVATGNLSKVSYQRLALRFEERDLEGVFELLPQLIAGFEKLGMSEDALKSRFLHAAVLKETDRLLEAKAVFDEIAREARSLGNEPLLALAYVNLVQIYGFFGDAEQALAKSNEAAEALLRLGNHTALAKLHWGIATLFRNRSEFSTAIETYRMAQREFWQTGMRADVAAVHLVIADLLLDVGQEKQAEWEIRQALPLIDEYKLVPEDFAAMTLLRESLRRQKIDRQALRNLHEHFEQKKP